MQDNLYDLFIIGGGINGTGIAADASGRGLSVVLCEQGDLGGATSSASSKLIHGGLRYLEHFEFKLVLESLHERAVLLKTAPHMVQPLRFIIPDNPYLRSPWLLRLGLYVYDFMATRTRLKRSRRITFNNNLYENPLNLAFKKGFIYSDCRCDDARMVILTAKRAQEHGALIRRDEKVVKASREGQSWLIETTSANGSIEFYRAKALVNAAGPFVDCVLKNVIPTNSKYQCRLVKGSHIVVPKLYEGEQAYLLQNADRRVVFVIPFHHQFSLIGTTDVLHNGAPNEHSCSQQEIEYLCQTASNYFHHKLKSQDVVHTFSGIRALFDDMSNNPSSVTRDYRLEVISDDSDQLPLLTVFGGKYTTYRHLAEKALDQLKPFFPTMEKPWTHQSPLPGGDIKRFHKFQRSSIERFAFLPKTLIKRYCYAYGTLINTLLAHTQSISDLGTHFGHGLYQLEVDYLIECEWAKTAEDILWRRSKLGLLFSKEEIQQLQQYLDN